MYSAINSTQLMVEYAIIWFDNNSFKQCNLTVMRITIKSMNIKLFWSRLFPRENSHLGAYAWPGRYSTVVRDVSRFMIPTGTKLCRYRMVFITRIVQWKVVLSHEFKQFAGIHIFDNCTSVEISWEIFNGCLAYQADTAFTKRIYQLGTLFILHPALRTTLFTI